MIRRRVARCCLVLAMCLASAGGASAGIYAVLTGGGAGGESGAGSLGGEVGWLGRRILVGVGLATVFNGGEWESINANELLSYDEKRNDDIESYAALGLKIVEGWRLVGSVGSNVASHTGRSTSRYGTTVVWDPEYEKGRVTVSGMLQYEYHWLLIGGGYHNLRGGVGRIGFRI